MTVDTIFISFCDDLDKNNGMDRPYYMSRELMEAMQEAKQIAGGSFNFNQGQQNVDAQHNFGDGHIPPYAHTDPTVPITWDY
jgi:hypothetical protein